MNWSALAAWLYENDQLDVAKAKAHGIEVIYIDPRSTNAAQVAAAIRAAGLTPGAYFATSWWPHATPAEFAQSVSNLLNHVLPRVGTAEAPPCMLDLEAVTYTWCAAAIANYRRHQPLRPTAYTNEPFKDSSIVPIDALIKAKMHWYLQLYAGDMTPVNEARATLQVCRIYPPSMVHPFYDGAALPSDAQDGCVFTLERIPS